MVFEMLKRVRHDKDEKIDFRAEAQRRKAEKRQSFEVYWLCYFPNYSYFKTDFSCFVILN